jgi:hypothetical protein
MRAVLEDRETEYAEVVRQRDEKRTEVRELELQANRLMRHIAALRDMLTEAEGAAEGTVVSIGSGGPTVGRRGLLVGLPRTQAIEIILTEAPAEIHRSEIVTQLRNRGFPTERPDDTSAALAYLKRCGRVVNTSRGYWRRASSSSAGESA